MPSILFFSLFFLVVNPSKTQSSTFRPTALLLPLFKDPSTLQYVTTVAQRTPPVSLNLVIDIGGRYLWIDCDDGYVSSTYRPARCGSAACSLAQSHSCGFGPCSQPPRPGYCNNNTCGAWPQNPFVGSSGELAVDALSVLSADGSKPGRKVTAQNFVFTCGPSFLLDRLAKGVKGIAGLGRNKVAVPSQFFSAFTLRRKFSLCLPSSSSSRGAFFFGDGPYVSHQGLNASASLAYTPLLTNPVSTASSYFVGEPSYEYFIGVKSIKVNYKRIPINSTLLVISSAGRGGAKISSVNPYTVLESTIYKAVADAFIRESKLKRVTAVAPFSTCFSSEDVASTGIGPAVAPIDLVLQRESVSWGIIEANSVVSVSDKVTCLALVDGGADPVTSIVIGGYQLENHFMEFDLAASRLGFSSSLLLRHSSCSDFNFAF